VICESHERDLADTHYAMAQANVYLANEEVREYGFCCMFRGLFLYYVVAIFHIEWCIGKP